MQTNLGYLLKAWTKANDSSSNPNNHSSFWEKTVLGAITRSLIHGSRQPNPKLPAWVALKVSWGGFTSGEAVSGGEILPHEQEFASKYDGEKKNISVREQANLYCLSPSGQDELLQMLHSRLFEVNSTDELLIMCVAFLSAQDHINEAQQIINAITPLISQIRFFPKPSAFELEVSSFTERQTVKELLEYLDHYPQRPRVVELIKAIDQKLPLKDQLYSLICKTCNSDGYPYSKALVNSPDFQEWQKNFSEIREKVKEIFPNGLTGKYTRSFLELFCPAEKYFSACGDQITGLEVVRARNLILERSKKFNTPLATRSDVLIKEQAAHIQIHKDLTDFLLVLKHRLKKLNPSIGILAEQEKSLTQPITEAEAELYQVKPGIRLPVRYHEAIQNTRRGSWKELAELGIISSAEMLADIVEPVIAGVDVPFIHDRYLQTLWFAYKGAFHHRRSLILFNMESQVQFEEIPGALVLKNFVEVNSEKHDTPLVVIVNFYRHSFAHTQLPNKLIERLKELLPGPWIKEIAADIFCHQFSLAWLQQAHLMASSRVGDVYYCYYGFTRESLLAIQSEREFYNLCCSRADQAKLNPDQRHHILSCCGMIIEQGFILTGFNLNLIFDPSIHSWSQDELFHACSVCLKAISKNISGDVRSAAYSLRQMLFFASQLDKERFDGLIALAVKTSPGASRLWRDLTNAYEGKRPEYCFVGYSTDYPHPIRQYLGI